MKSKRIFF